MTFRFLSGVNISGQSIIRSVGRPHSGVSIVISDIHVTPGALSALVTWTTDLPSNSFVEYGATTAYGHNVSDAALVTSHARMITGLDAETLYHFRVKAVAPTGQGTSTDNTFTTDVAIPAGAFGLWNLDTLEATPRLYVPNVAVLQSPSLNLGGPPRRLFQNSQFWRGVRLTIADNVVAGPDALMEASTIVAASARPNPWYLTPSAFGGSQWLPAGTYTVAVNVRQGGAGSPDFKLGEFNTDLAAKTATGSWQRFSHTFTAADSTFFPMMTSVNNTDAATLEICNFELFAGSSDLGPLPPDSNIYFQTNTTVAPTPAVNTGTIDFNTDDWVGYLQLPQVEMLQDFTVSYLFNPAGTGFDGGFQPVIAVNAGESGGSWREYEVGSAQGHIGPSMNGTALDTGESRLFTSRGRGPVCLTHTFDGTTLRHYINGVFFRGYAATVDDANFSDFNVGSLQQAYFSGYKIAGLGLWPRALDAAEVDTVYRAFADRAAANGLTLEPLRTLIYEGDSIAFGQNADSDRSCAALVADETRPVVRSNNFGTGGAIVATLESRAASVDAMLPPDKLGKKYALSVFVGSNDLNQTFNNAVAFTNALASYIDDRRTAGWDFIMVGTVMSRTGGLAIADGGAQHQLNRLDANPIILSWLGGRVDAVFDFASNANLGADGAANNATYFTDMIHPTNAGHRIMANMELAALAGFDWGY